MSFQPAPLLAKHREKRPIGARFYSGGAKFSYLGEDLEDALREPEEAIARMADWERTAEHFHGVLSGEAMAPHSPRVGVRIHS